MASQFMNKLTEELIEAISQILKYLKMTTGQILFLKKNKSKKLKCI